MASTVRPSPRKKARKPRKFGVIGPQAAFNFDLVLDIVASQAARENTSRYKTLVSLLEDAGFTDRPAWQTWRQWENRRKIASSWMPTILYAALAAGEQITIKQLLTVHE